jgi:hypothetical protein
LEIRRGAVEGSISHTRSAVGLGCVVAVASWRIYISERAVDVRAGDVQVKHTHFAIVLIFKRCKLYFSVVNLSINRLYGGRRRVRMQFVCGRKGKVVPLV